MKTFQKTLCAALLGLLALATAPAQAQSNRPAGRPAWGPPVPAGARYSYIPETQGFYDVPARQYVVQRNGQWIRTSTLNGLNPSNFHPVVVDYVGAQPWERQDEYRAKYPNNGHPHGMPPGQAKKQGYRSNPSNGGLPPGQAKKQNQNGNVLPGGLPRTDDRRYDDRTADRTDDPQNQDRRYERRDDDRGNGRGNGRGKGNGKGKGRD
jgi:hypothetical protein